MCQALTPQEEKLPSANCLENVMSWEKKKIPLLQTLKEGLFFLTIKFELDIVMHA